MDGIKSAPQTVYRLRRVGASGVTRTPDLLITKSVQTLKVLIFSPFVGFPLGKFQTYPLSFPFLPTPFFPVVGRGVGQQATLK